VVAVPVAALLGLFVHAHPDDHDTDHHEARAIHAHLGGHAQAARHGAVEGPVISDGEDDHDRAVYFDAYVGEAITSSSVVAAVPPAVDVPAPAVRRAQPPLQVVHGHDPPGLAFRPTRAPPRLPVLI
jgi:hypothetical protein